MIDQRGVRVNAYILASRIWLGVSANSLITVQSGLRSNPVVTRNENRSDLSPMTPTTVVRFDLARTLIKNCGTSELWSRSVNWPINHCDRDARTRVSFSSRLVEVVVGKIGLVSGSDRVGGTCRRSGNSNESQGTSRRADCREGRAHSRAVTSHHWRGSHPSSSRFAGARSLSDP